ncbi:MAG: iron-containing alcohol dehydrogenase [Candidatus Lokiarchaeota archaeon]|nr:iron-containing alcohol dehydrogenase [Candidatus Lokiarchaeota archaeon]
MSMNFIKVPTIYNGKGSLKELRNMKQKRVLVVTDKTIRDLFGKKIERYLRKKEFAYFDEIEPDPRDETIIKGAKFAKEFKPDLITGLGGGSVMDSAKGIYFLYEREDKNLYDINPLNYFKLGKKSKLILVPTTSGTGAEHTSAIIVSNSETKQKIGLISYELVPSAVIIDPKLPLKMPKTLTASTGVDAIVHAVESIMNKLSNDFTDAVNLHAIKLLFEFLPQSYENGKKNLRAREKVHNAASLAGIGLANSAAGLAHSCGHSLGALFDIQHGIAVGIMLPYIIEFNSNISKERYKLILDALNVEINSSPTKALTELILKLFEELQIPTKIQDLGISKEIFNNKIKKLTDFTISDLATSLNPRTARKEDVERIFYHAFNGKSIDF